MSTVNPFDLLGNEEYDDPSQIILAAEKLKQATPAAKAPAPAAKPAKLPTKPLPPSQAVKESKNEGGRGGRGRGRGHSGGEFNRESFNNNSTYGGPPMPFKGSGEGDGKTIERRGGYGGPRGTFRGGRRGGFSNGDVHVPEGERPPRRVYERHSGTGRDNGFKRDGAGRGNWGTSTDEIASEVEESPIQKEKVEDEEKRSGEEDAGDANKEKVEEVEEKEPEAKEMTLEEYEKVREEKRKALLALKTAERKVDDKEFKSMQQISSKKNNDEIFVKLGTEKDKRKEAAEKEEKVRKSVNITEFLKPAEGERSYGGRGRGRGRGPRGGFNGGSYNKAAPPADIKDPGHFPSLGGQ